MLLPDYLWDDSWVLPFESQASINHKYAYLNGLDNIKYKPSTADQLQWESAHAHCVIPAFASTLRICPKCMRVGYHSTLHQFTGFDHCFIHPECSIINVDMPLLYLESKSMEKWEQALAGVTIDPQNVVIESLPLLKEKILDFTAFFPSSLAVYDFNHGKNKALTDSTKTYINDILQARRIEECDGFVDGYSLIPKVLAYLADYRDAAAKFMLVKCHFHITYEEALEDSYIENDERVLRLLVSAPEASLVIWAHRKISQYVPTAYEKKYDFFKDTAFDLDNSYNSILVKSIPRALWPIYAAMLIGYSVQNFRYVFEALDMTLIGHFAFSDRDEGVIDRDTYHNGVCMSPTLLCDMTTKSLLDIYPYDRENHYSPY
ncbi:MAG: hypothetical protein J6N21_17365, partial [Butyrivibrio sp.]|nr:hypothetical protein [Butyrivibrio sp.]